jgi:predicted house-cleaning noncanonical NTP pyrophosphatase (MazG superfamily)
MKEYNKLVRDNIPRICKEHGDIPTTRIIEDDAEYLRALTTKLGEEAAEVQATPNLEELADVLEVVQGIGKALGYTPDQIEEARVQKAEARGGFDDRVFLISTESKEA